MARDIRLRLYRPQDYDLYCLYYDKHFFFGEAVRRVLNAYVRGEEPPRIDVSQVKAIPKGMLSSVCVGVQIRDADADVLDMMDYLFWNGRNGNAFVKSLLRRSFVGLDHLYFQDAADKWPDAEYTRFPAESFMHKGRRGRSPRMKPDVPYDPAAREAARKAAEEAANGMKADGEENVPSQSENAAQPATANVQTGTVWGKSDGAVESAAEGYVQDNPAAANGTQPVKDRWSLFDDIVDKAMS